MKRVTWLITMIVVTTVSPSYSASTPKPGTPCPKQNVTKVYKDKKHTCIKAGKKLIWDKGVRATQPASAPSPTPTNTTPTSSSSNDPSLSAREQAYNLIRQAHSSSKGASSKREITIVSHPTTKQADLDEIRTRANDAISFFGADASGERLHIIVGNMAFLSWTNQELKKVQPANSSGHDEWEKWVASNVNSNNRCTAWNAGSHGFTSDGAGLISVTFEPNDCTNRRQVVWRTTVEHEVVNHLQNRWFKGRVDLMPCWLNEGQAVYYGSALGTAMNFTEFKEVLAWHKRFKREDLMSAAKRLGYGIGSSCGVEGGYEAGRLLVEQLIIEFGHVSLLDYTKSIVDTPGSDSEKWKVAFEQHFKISYDKWLEKVVPEIEKREL
jgi:hypothetical protein